MALEPTTATAERRQVSDAPPPVISLVPTTPDEIAQIGTQLSALGSEITGSNGNIELMVSSYSWNLSYDFNVNWRVAGGHPATGHLPSCASRDIQTTWTPPA